MHGHRKLCIGVSYYYKRKKKGWCISTFKDDVGQYCKVFLGPKYSPENGFQRTLSNLGAINNLFEAAVDFLIGRSHLSVLMQ